MQNQDTVLPKHIGIIVDGNGRWATSRGLPRSMGHKGGAKTLKKLLPYIYEKGIFYVSIFVFSTENFQRDKKEVEYLMKLFIQLFQKEFTFLKKQDVKVVFSGRREPLPDEVWQAMKQIEETTKNGKNGVLNICLNYGGQYEIVDMVKKVVQLVKEEKLDALEITKEVVEENLYQQLPPLDFIIRTSGELRSSNFMLYQSAYAEYYFPKTYFPDFNQKEFDLAIIEFQKRKRRFGKN